MRSLAGSRTKLKRAYEQIDALRTDLNAAMKPNGNAFKVDLKNDTYDGFPAITLYVVGMPTFDPSISVTIGEITHNLRSAMDQVAWALVPRVKLKSLNDDQVLAIQYPMAESPTNWRNTVNRRLPGTTPDQRAFIKRYQPYRRSVAGRAIRALQILFNTDKHRAIIPALIFPTDYNFHLEYVGHRREFIRRTGRGKQVKLGADLCTWTFETVPQNVRMDATINLSPGFRPSLIRPSRGNDFVRIGGLLESIAAICDEVLSHFETEG